MKKLTITINFELCKYILIVIISVSMFVLMGCNEGIQSTTPIVNKGHIKGSILDISEFTYEGCQYIYMDAGIAHKGNCTNSIHVWLENK